MATFLGISSLLVGAANAYVYGGYGDGGYGSYGVNEMTEGDINQTMTEDAAVSDSGNTIIFALVGAAVAALAAVATVVSMYERKKAALVPCPNSPYSV